MRRQGSGRKHIPRLMNLYSLEISRSMLCLNMLKTRKPTLCICRGIQLLNCFEGGDLYQDIDDLYKTDINHALLIMRTVMCIKFQLKRQQVL